MRIEIEYEASWRNSFLNGCNNLPLPKSGRKFIGSMTSLGKAENFIHRDVTIDTVMGILNRLIGDQRKLYQSRKADAYYFRDLEPLISFSDNLKVINQEMTFIRNLSGSTDQNSYTGAIKKNDAIFCSDYSREFWGILNLELSELFSFVLRNDIDFPPSKWEPILICERLNDINKLKPIENSGEAREVYQYLSDKFDKFKGVNAKGLLLQSSLYCSSLYLQLSRLSKKYDMSTAKSKAGGISGISNNGFTKKDFMGRFTTGEKKKVWGNPYIIEEFVKGEGKTKRFMTKASGTLEININVDREKAKEITKLIDYAGVSSFYVGKKGLAYVSKIRL